MPQLPLAVFTRGTSERQPLAVSHDGRRASVLLCSRSALARGVRPGMPVAAARALAHDLIVRQQDTGAEREALQALASWSFQFTAQVSLHPPCELLLEVQGSFMLFGGPDILFDRIREGLRELGYRARLASAPTPLAAQTLARCQCEQHVADAGRLAAALAPLPVSALDWEQGLVERLAGMGVERLGELLRLPRDGLARRFGSDSLLHLDRMLGRCPHLLPPYRLPPVFGSRLQLPAEVDQAQALLFALQRLLLELCGWLTGQGAGVQRIDIRLHHREREPTRFTLAMHKPGRDAGQLTVLLRHRLERLVLPAPVTDVGLYADETQRLDARSRDLFDDTADEPVNLLDCLRARLGSRAVTGISAVAEHRPEYAWRYSDPADSHADGSGRQRPLWLLPEPRLLAIRNGRPQLQGELRLQPGRERIESGWWDEREVARDYFIATNPAGSCYWIYRELTGERRWFLQGLFE